MGRAGLPPPMTGMAKIGRRVRGGVKPLDLPRTLTALTPVIPLWLWRRLGSGGRKLLGRTEFSSGFEGVGGFDPQFYRFMHPALAERTDDELWNHYREQGWRNSWDPAPDFSVDAYFEVNRDVAEQGIDPFQHFLRHGRSENRTVHLSRWGRTGTVDCRAEFLDLAAPFVSREHVVALRPELGALSARAVVSWWLVAGWAEGIDPSPDLSLADLAAVNAAAAASGRNPLVARIESGGTERLAERVRSRAATYRLVAPDFDAGFYRACNPDLSDMNDAAALDHFMRVGWTEGRDPSAAFSTEAALSARPHLRAAGINPLVHEVLGRRPAPAARAATLEEETRAVRADFDAAWYRATYGDVEGDDEAQLAHFMTVGWRERRDPNAEFSTSFYLDSYADIAEAGINPFVHYVVFGRKERRRAHPSRAMRLVHDPAASSASGLPRWVVEGASDGDRLPADPPQAEPSADTLSLHWVIPDFTIGGGGHATIFRMIRAMETAGHRCTIWIEEAHHHRDAEAAWQDIVKNFNCVSARVAFVEDGFFRATGDIAVATSWTTAYAVERARGFAAKCYFVQDHESEFHATGASSLLAERTYGFDFGCICAGPWLETLMRERYGRWARSFHLAFDPEIYRIADPDAQEARFAVGRPGPVRIAVYARTHTERRCVGLVLAALELLGRQGAPIEVHFFGQSAPPVAAFPLPAFHHGVLAPEELAALYNSCDIGICLSATNYSLVPKEMMACGLALVELDTASTRAVFDPDIVTLAGPTPSELADAIRGLVDDPGNRRARAEASLDWVSRFCWDDAGRKVEAAFRSYLAEVAGAPLESIGAPAVRTRPAPMLDVVIPTWNGADELPEVIGALRRQTVADRMRICCIDSSSTDGSAEWLARQPDIDLISIPQSEFQHGRTRNMAAASGAAPVIAFLTQDAVPATRHWAADILRMFDHVPEAAGLFGRHVAHPRHPAWVRDEIDAHFAGFAKLPLVLSRDTDPERWASGDPGWRQVLHFYSDNNSAMRRAVWNDRPYPEVVYAEDQLWARDIIEAGLTKLYAPTAVVRHSHDYGPDEAYERSRTEAAFFKEHFGYDLGAGTAEDLAAAIAREQAAFRAWAAGRNLPPEQVDRRMATIAAQQRGWRDGSMISTA